MPFEVEQKFPVAGDSQELRHRMAELGAIPCEAVFQQDLYFNHPGRDFATTDEALRIRTVGERNFVTYKGPKLDPRVKTRQEIELPLGDRLETAEQFGEMLTLLGFRSVRTVRKERTVWSLRWEGRDWELAWDQVDNLGTFVEIETIAQDQVDLLATQDLLLKLAERLYLEHPERKSYLELLLEKKCD